MTHSQLTGLIQPPGESPCIGNENGDLMENGISVLYHKTGAGGAGSYRFVMAVEGEIVAGLQVMSRGGVSGTIANLFVAPDHRRAGHATALYEAAAKMFPELTVSDDLSDDGRAFMSAVSGLSPALGRSNS